jgi:hypothetical protein
MAKASRAPACEGIEVRTKYREVVLTVFAGILSPSDRIGRALFRCHRYSLQCQHAGHPQEPGHNLSFELHPDPDDQRREQR